MSTILRLPLLPLLVLTATVCHAQDAPSSNARQMQELSWIVGDWSADLLAEKAIPGVVEKGDKLRLDMSCAWGLGQNVIAVTWDVKAGKTVLITHKGMIGWDAGKKQAVSFGFDSTGKYAISAWSNEDGTWSLKGYESKPGEGAGSRMRKISEIQSDQFTFQTVHSVEAGNSETPQPKIIFQRVK